MMPVMVYLKAKVPVAVRRRRVLLHLGTFEVTFPVAKGTGMLSSTAFSLMSSSPEVGKTALQAVGFKSC